MTENRERIEVKVSESTLKINVAFYVTFFCVILKILMVNKLTEQINERYGSFELSHEKNTLIVRNIEEFVSKVAIMFTEWMGNNTSDEGNGFIIDSTDEVIANNIEELFIYFKENVYGITYTSK